MKEAGVFRPVTGPLIVQCPYWWLRIHLGREPCRVGTGTNCWSVPRSRFRSVVESACQSFDKVTVIDDRRRSSRVCDVRCWNARGQDCGCICLGTRHGGTPRMGELALNGTSLIETDTTRFTYTYEQETATVGQTETTPGEGR